MSEVTRLVTADELERFPEDDCRYELVRGRLIRMSPVGWQHGGVVVHLISFLSRYLDDHPVGVIRTEVGFRLQSSPDTVRAPDVAFVRRDRVPAVERSGFVHGAPDLVVEVLSPDDSPAETRDKIDEYLRAGVSVVVVVDPRKNRATVHRPAAAPVMLCGDDAVLDIGDPLPGFRCRLGDLFK
jgi:Uma2 family endonuclease